GAAGAASPPPEAPAGLLHLEPDGLAAQRDHDLAVLLADVGEPRGAVDQERHRAALLDARVHVEPLAAEPHAEAPGLLDDLDGRRLPAQRHRELHGASGESGARPGARTAPTATPTPPGRRGADGRPTGRRGARRRPLRPAPEPGPATRRW